MTPQERAEQVVSDLPMIDLYPVTKYRLTEVIRVAIVEATNSELEKRRAAEAIVIRQNALAGDETRDLLQSANATLEAAKTAHETQTSKLDAALLALDTVQSMAKEIYWETSTDSRKVERGAAAIIETCDVVLNPSGLDDRRPTLVEGEFKPPEPEAREAAAPDPLPEPVTCTPEMTRFSLEEIRRLAHVGYVRGAPGVDSICLKIRSLCDGVLNEPDLEVPYVPLICKNCNKSAPTLSTAGWCSACFLKHEHPDFVTGNTPRREQEPPQKRVSFEQGEFHHEIINALQAVLNVAEHNPQYVAAILLRRAQAAIDAMRPTPNPARSIEHTYTTACDCWKCRNLRGQTD